MHVDALTLAAVASELRAWLPGARVDDVIQPTPRAIALQCYGNGRNRWLLVSAHPELARVHLIERKPRKLVTEPPAFVMLLRKYLEGARVREVRQPAWERLLEVSLSHTREEAPVWLVVEVMGQLSNVVLRDDAGTILGALRQVGAEVNRYRTIAPNVPYRYPPPQTRMVRGEPVPRLDGTRVTGDELRSAGVGMLEGQSSADGEAPAPARARGARGRTRARPLTVVTLLTGHIAGFSRELAAEVAVRALGTPDAPDAPLTPDLPWDALAAGAQELAALPTTDAWHPTLVYPSAEAPRPEAFAVYTPRQYAGAVLREAASVNEMLASYYEGAEWRVAVESAKGDLRRLLQTHRDRGLRKDEALRGELAALDEARRLRLEADTLLAFQTEVPAGARDVTLPDPFAVDQAEAPAATLTIPLDPRLSAVENATKKYERYHKLQRAGKQIPGQIEANTLELARVEQLLTDLALAESPAEIVPVRGEIAEAGYLRSGDAGRLAKGTSAKAAKHGKTTSKSGKAGKGASATRRAPEGGAPLRRRSSDGFTLVVGKNSRQNEDVTFHEASAGDLWLHARGVPGAHVVVKAGGRPVPETTLHEAAALAAFYSQSRAAASVPVDHTQQRYVRHMKGGGPGMVIYEREHTLHVAPEDAGAPL